MRTLPSPVRTSLGFLSAYAASVLMAFLSSCIFIFVSFGDGDYARLFAGLLAVDKTAWSVLFVHVLAYTAFGAMLAAPVLFLIGKVEFEIATEFPLLDDRVFGMGDFDDQDGSRRTHC